MRAHIETGVSMHALRLRPASSPFISDRAAIVVVDDKRSSLHTQNDGN